MKKFILFAIPALILLSCNNREQEQQSILPGQAAVTLQDVNFHPTGKDEYTFAVTANTSYKFEFEVQKNTPEWLHIYLDDGSDKEIEFGKTVIPAGTMSFVLRADFNTDARPDDFNIGDCREGIIRVEANDGTFSEEVTISQPYPYLRITTLKPGEDEEVEITTEDSILFSWDYTQEEPFNKEPIVFTIESNTDWSIAADQSQPYVLVTDNDEEADLLPYERNIQNYASTRTDENVLLNHWLVSPRLGEYKENAEKVHHISFIPNSYHTEDVEREVSIIIASTEDSTGESIDKYQITFSQNFVRFMFKDQFEANCDELFYQSCYTEPQIVNIDSELEWYAEVGDTDNWISLSPENPKTPESAFSVNIDHLNCSEGANAYTEEQNGTIVIWGFINKNQDDNLKIKKEIQVHQNPYVFSLLDSSTEQDAQDIELENIITTNNIVNIQSSGDWTITSEQDWLHFSKEEGAGSHGAENPGFEEVAITTDNYNLDTEESRETTVSLVSKLNELERSFKITQPAYIFTAEAQDKELSTFDTKTHQLEIKSTGNWRVDVDYSSSANEEEEWLEFSSKEGIGNETITYQAKTGNGYTEDRKAKIIVVSIPHELEELTLTQEIDVRQLKYTFETSMSNDTPTFSAIATESYELTINCSADWSIEAPEWIQIEEKEGSGNATLLIRAKNNYSYIPLSETIVVKSVYEPTGTEYKAEYPVTQDGFVFNVTPESISDVPAFIRDEKYNISVFSSADWSVVKDDDFKNNVESISPETYGPEEEVSVALTPKSNPKKEENVFKISFKTGDEHPLIKSVQVAQKAYEFNDKEETFSFEALNDKTFDVEVVCSGDWELINRPVWLTTNATNEKGSGNATLTLKATNNYQLEPNEETIILQSLLHKALGLTDGFERCINVSQAPFVFDTERVSGLPNFGSTFDLEQDIPVGECYGIWSIKSYPSWMEKPVISPDFSKISLKAKENVTVEPNTGTVRIESEYISQNAKLFKEIEVSQLPLVFDDENIEAPQFGAIDNLTYLFNIGQCDGGWKVLSHENWISVSPETGSGNQRVTITADLNDSLEPKESSITIVSQKNADLKKVITISQEAFKFDTNEASAQFKSITDLSKDIPVGECYGKWNIHIDDRYADWLTATKSSTGVKITVSENVEMSGRAGVVRIESEFYSENNKLYKEIKVSQDALQFDTASVSKKSFGSITGLTQTFDIGRCDGGWKVQHKPSWIEMAMSGAGNETVTITATPNYELIARPEENIILESVKNPTLVKKIPVDQAAFKFDTNEYSAEKPFGSVEDLQRRVELGHCDGKWNVVENYAWINVTPTTGTGSATITITANENTTLDSRPATIRIESEFIQHNSKLYKEIKVSQDALQFDTAPVTKKSFGSITGLTQTFDIGRCDGGWKVQNKPSWIEMEMSGAGNETVTITATPNYELIARPEENIILESVKNPTLVKIIPVDQAAFKFDTKEASLDEFDAIGGTKTTSWESGDEGLNPVIENPSWIKEVRISGNTITVIAKANANTDRGQQDEIIIKSKYFGNNPALIKKIKVSQKALVFDTTPISLEGNPFGSVEDLQRRVELGHCDGKWNVVENYAWINVTPTTGSGSATITITANENTTKVANSATIRIESEFIQQNPNLYKEIKVSQKTLQFDTGTVPNNMTFGAIPSEGQTFDIGQCDGGWKVLSHENWISVSPETGSGNQRVTITADLNDSLDPKEGSITIVSQKNADLKKVITISQEAFKFDIARETKIFKALTELSQQVTMGESDGRWNVVENCDWLTVTPATGSGNATITITANENTTKVAKSATIRIESEYISQNAKLFKEIEVSQLPLVFDDENIESPQFGAIDNLTYLFNIGQCDGGWKVLSQESWVNAVTPNSGNGNESVTITANPNYQLVANNGSITIVSRKNADLKKVITISQEAFKFDTNEASAQFKSITDLSKDIPVGECYGKWNIRIDDRYADWLTATKSSTGVKITVSENVEMSGRAGVVRIESEFYSENNKLYKEIKVSQDALQFDTAPVSKKSFGSITGLTQTFDIGRCDGGWKVQHKPSWIEMEMSGAGNEEVTITATPNYELIARPEENIILESVKNPTHVKKIPVEQAAFKFDTNEYSAEKPFGSVEDLTRPVNIGTCDGKWNVVESYDWLTVTPITGSGNATITITANENTTKVAKSATIRIESEFIQHNSKLYKEIKVSQDALQFDTASVSKKSFGAVTGLPQTFDIGRCDGGWKVQNKPSWIEMAMSGAGNEEVTITATPNYELIARPEENIILESVKNPTLVKKIPVDQAAFRFDTNGEERKFGAQTDLEKEVTIGDCDGDWEITDALPDWLSVSKTEGPGRETITLTATPNDTEEERGFKVTLKSVYYEHNSKLHKVITVKQEPFIEEPPVEE